MKFRRTRLLSGLVLLLLTACSGPAQPQPTASFTGWIPPASPALTAFADCLRQQQVQVSDIVGAFVLVPAEAQDQVKVAETICREKLDEFHATIFAPGDRKVGDQRTFNFIHQVRNCFIRRFDITVDANQTVLPMGDGIAGAQFKTCVDEIRAYPTPSVL